MGLYKINVLDFNMSSLVLGLIAAFCWGLHDIAIRYLSRTVPLMGLLLTVLIVGLGFQGIVLLVEQGGFSMAPDALFYSVCAGASFLMASLGLYFAFERGPVRLVSPIIGAYPVLSLTYAAIGGSIPSVDQILAVLMVIFALAMVVVISDGSAEETPPKGLTVLFSLVAAVGFATAFELGHWAGKDAGELESSLITRATAVVLLLVGIMVFRPKIRMDTRAFPLMCLMGVLDGVALLAIFMAADLDKPEFAAVSASMFGMFTILLARVFLREPMKVTQWAWCIIAFLSVGYLML